MIILFIILSFIEITNFVKRVGFAVAFRPDDELLYNLTLHFYSFLLILHYLVVSPKCYAIVHFTLKDMRVPRNCPANSRQGWHSANWAIESPFITLICLTCCGFCIFYFLLISRKGVHKYYDDWELCSDAHYVYWCPHWFVNSVSSAFDFALRHATAL